MPTFMQSLPDHGPWTLIQGDKRSGQLVYRDDKGTEVMVPSIWYNQPISWRIDYFRFCAQRALENAARMLASKDRWAKTRAKEFRAQAKQLERDAKTMERTGKFV